MNEKVTPPRPAGTRVSAEEIETTAAEKLLAVVLAIFIGIGAIWVYVKLDEVNRPVNRYAYVGSSQVLDSSELAALQLHRTAVQSARASRGDLRAATHDLELRREAYRTALDAGQPAAALEQQYLTAQEHLQFAEGFRRTSLAEVQRTAPGAAAAEEKRLNAYQDAQDQRAEQSRSHDRLVFFLRIGLLILMLAASYRLLGRLRSRNSRYQPAAFAWIGATAILAIVMAGDYMGNYIAFDKVGPLVISIAGIALTLGAFAALQRFLSRRLPARRVRRRECPFCGFPGHGNRHCEGCGRTLIAPCASCTEDRRVGTPRCGACGNA